MRIVTITFLSIMLLVPDKDNGGSKSRNEEEDSMINTLWT